jgi:hypothetical protein
MGLPSFSSGESSIDGLEFGGVFLESVDRDCLSVRVRLVYGDLGSVLKRVLKLRKPKETQVLM